MDTVSKTARSAMMAAVRGKDTAPELFVRSKIHQAGFRYRVHVRSLPGAPDIVLPKYRTVVLIHGCFWHGHTCPRGRRPSSNTKFWNSKLSLNVHRDARNEAALKRHGWNVITIWTCQIDRDLRKVLNILTKLRRDFSQRNAP